MGYESSNDWTIINARPNFALVWLALLLRTREVPGSNLGPETGVLTGFLVFRSLLGENAKVICLHSIQLRTLSSTYFPIHQNGIYN
jgi:hypothetical protein